ncbi:unnamed protein product [Trifolium pratense]|uniref:Uncharacterized protein n=1 Tax=Trifolium pratense TaxID=57577 RepID=A0ACB0LUB3_TRIPR|nr:unnamed protein product [Trifolium pratense]
MAQPLHQDRVNLLLYPLSKGNILAVPLNGPWLVQPTKRTFGPELGAINTLPHGRARYNPPLRGPSARIAAYHLLNGLPAGLLPVLINS